MLKTTVLVATCLALMAVTALLAAKSTRPEPIQPRELREPVHFDAPLRTPPATIWR